MWPFRRKHSITGLLTTHDEGYIISPGWNEYWTVTLTPQQQILLYNHVRIKGTKTSDSHIVAEEITLLG